MGQPGVGFDPASFLPLLLFSLVGYVYFAACLMIIASKTATPSAWLAWIPFANLFLMCAVARKSVVWFLLLLIPFVNIVCFIILWRAIARARGKPDWMAFLLIVPFVNLIVPAYFAAGPATLPAPGGPHSTAEATSHVGIRRGPAAAPRAPAGGARPGVCPSCGAAIQPDDAFCGECGTPASAPPTVAAIGSASCPSCGAALTGDDAFCGECGAPIAGAEAAAPAPQLVPRRAPKGAPVAAIAVIAILLLALAAGAWFVFGAGYRAPQRVRPSLPPAMAGTLSEFPVDLDPRNPAQPTAFTSQKLGRGSGYRPLPGALPPSLDPGSLVRGAGAVSSATYRTGPQTPPVHVAVLDIPRSPRAAGVVAVRIQSAIGGQRTAVQVQRPNGSLYSGFSIRTIEQLIYVLLNPQANHVIVVWAPQSSVFPVAQRLAGNVGNGERVVGTPVVRSTFGSIPAALPIGLTLTEIRNVTPGALGVNLSALDGIASQASSAEIQQFVSRTRMLIPRNLTTLRYLDRSGNAWNTLVGDYGTANRARMAWWLIRFTAGMGMKPVKLAGGEGLYSANSNEPFLLFRKGPYLSLVGTTPGASMEQLLELASSIQL